MARKKTPSNQGAVWTTTDFAAIRRLVLNIYESGGRSVAHLGPPDTTRPVVS